MSESSTVEDYKYDAKNKTLIIEFKNGTVYEYPDATRADFDALDQARSKGQHVQRVIAKKFPSFRKFIKQQGRKGPARLDVSHRITSNNPIRSDIPQGKCPACGTPALGWEPPKDNPLFMQAMERFKQIHDLASIEDAIRAYLKKNGYIERCSECSVSHYVRGFRAKLKE